MVKKQPSEFDVVIVGAGPDAKAGADVRILTADGTEINHFTAFDDYTYGVCVAAADLDGDGKAEIVVGAGPDKHAGKTMKTKDNTEHTLKAFSALGVLQFSVQPYAGTGYGVNVAIGELGL